jgi:hypothetical protein
MVQNHSHSKGFSITSSRIPESKQHMKNVGSDQGILLEVKVTVVNKHNSNLLENGAACVTCVITSCDLEETRKTAS